MRKPPRTTKSSAASTTVSVSGRGTSTAGLMCSDRLQNSLSAENARDRLALEPALAQRIDRLRLRLERAFAVRHQLGAIDAERMRDQQARVGVGGVDPARRNFSASACRAVAMVRVAAAASRRALGRQQLGLMLGDQRIDQLVQRLAGQHLRRACRASG